MHLQLTPIAAFRLAGLAAAGFLIGWYFPAMAEPAAHGADLVIAVVFAGIAGFLLHQGSVRYRELQHAVYLELNKLRRMYHVSKNLLAISQKFRPWFTDLHGLLQTYMTDVGGRDLAEYSKSNVAYRKLSYHIYTAPEPASHLEQTLFNELLRTQGLVAEERQRVKELLSQNISAYVWAAVLLLAAALIAAIVAAVGPGMAERVVAGAAVAAVILTLDLLGAVYSIREQRRDWSKRYVNNLAKLDYSREH